MKLLSLFSKQESNFSYSEDENSCFCWDVSNNAKLCRAPCSITLPLFIRAVLLSSSVSGYSTSMAKWMMVAALEISGRKSFKHNGNTGCPYFTPVCWKSFSFNAPCQFTPLFIHVYLVSGVLPFGWQRARTLSIVCETDGTEQNRENERSHDQGGISQLTCGRHVVRPRITVQSTWFVCLFVCICSTLFILLAKGTMEFNKVTKTVNIAAMSLRSVLSMIQ